MPTGYETCPWEPAALYQFHVTADVAYSVRQYMYATSDVNFLNSEHGKTLAMEIARFWKSKSFLRDEAKGYEIHGKL